MALPEAPREIGRYLVESTLGAGAMGVVYKAHDPVIDRAVAIKLVRANLLDGESREGFLRRFHNEARLAGRCSHPNIIAVHDYATHEGNPFLVMEYVAGADLGRVFKRGSQTSVANACHVALGVLDALSYAHAFGIVHRDIKPANILMTANGGIKVADFGISRLDVPDARQTAMLLGTPSYMAPEQCRGEAVDGRCDLFALGCVIFELLAGRRAFAGETYLDTIRKITGEPHPALAGLRADLPAPLVEVVDRALSKRADERYADAAEMAAALRALSEAASPRAESPTAIVLPSPPETRETRGGLTLDGSSLSTIERRLAHDIGPMASFHLRRALARAQSVGELCEQLAEALPEGAPRTRFIREMSALLSASVTLQGSSGSGAPGSLDLDAATLSRVTRALAAVMGPIAPRLVARAQARATSLEHMEELCTGLIPRPEERTAFRRLLREGGGKRGG